MQITNLVCPSSKYSIKCPYTMVPEDIIVHNTANDASAMAEVSYMIGNNNKVSFHAAADDYRIVTSIPFGRNTWNTGDGSNGKGNRKGIAIEICYSKSGGEKFDKAEENAAEYIAYLLKQYGWGIDRVKKHQDFNGKYCPHRTLDYGWERFLNKIRKYLGEDINVDNTNNSNNEEGFEVKTWQNGSTNETVYQDLACTQKIGTIYPKEYADCYGIMKGKYIVAYYVTDKNGNVTNRKLGFVKYSGGVK